MSAGQTPLLRQPLFWLLALLILAVLFCHRQPLARQPDLAMNSARGYKAAVDMLAAKKCLKLGAKDGRKKIIFDGRPQGCPSQAQFDRYSNSPTTYLAADMAALVDQRWQFGDEGAVVAIRSNTHSLRFAATDSSLWGGKITYADGHGRPATGLAWTDGNSLEDKPGTCAAQNAKLYQYAVCGGKLWQRVERLRSISEMDGSTERSREPTLASVAKRLETGDMSGDVTSSIWHDLHFRMQDLLEAHLKNAKNAPGKEEETVRAGLLLMDGLTGEIQAVATHPAKLTHIGGDGHANWMEKNWNFERMPIGSTAKIPFAAAIMDARPELLRRRAKPRPALCEGNKNCLGRVVETPGVDFRQFVARSSNSYALWLLDQARRGQANGWEKNMRKLACVEPLQARRDPSCATHLWMSSEGRPLGIGEALLRLEMDDVRKGEYYNHYYTNILGAGRWGWTSANLAQAYARIFSGRAVNPRLTPGKTVTETVEINATLWTAIRDGMAGVLLKEKAGTGYPLCKAIPCQQGNHVGDLWLYAKTGTATISAGDDDAKALVLLAVRTKTGQAPARPADIASMKVVVITQRFRREGQNPVDLAADLFRDPQFRAWVGLGQPQALAKSDKK